MKKSLISLSLITSMFIFSGCNGTSPSLVSITEPIKKLTQKEVKRNKELPIPSQLKNISSEASVSIEWDLDNKHMVEGYNIYRNDNTKESTKFSLVETIDNKFSTHYVDTKLKPEQQYSYIITSFDKNGESLNSKTLTTITKTRINPVSFLETINNLPNMIKVIWRPQVDSRVSGYIIEKLVDNEWKEQITINNNLTVEYFDTNLDNNETGKYRIISLSKEGQKSKPSKVVIGNTKPLPHIVENVNASFNFPKSIDLSWTNNREKDILKYKIYREGKLSSLFGKLGVETIAETTNNNIRLNFKEDGLESKFFITAIDKDGLESKMQSEAILGQTKPKPGSPYFTLKQIAENGINLNWNVGDERNVDFKILKTTKNNFIDSDLEEIKISGTSFTDTNLKKDSHVTYQIIGIDKDGIESIASEEVRFGIQ